MEKLVVLSGAGVSTESGLKTFRDAGGLWEGHRVEDVATPEAWQRNPALVLQFYNERRKALLEAKPNPGHLGLVELERRFDVTVITQNVDDLHERAGSSKVLHLHGELMSARSTRNPRHTQRIEGWELALGAKCPQGSQLRPDIVWFGEAVPMMDRAIEIAGDADIFLVVGTSLAVYPAASLIYYVPPESPKYLIDPNIPAVGEVMNLECIAKAASSGVPELVARLLATH